mmetsp:Transcript_13944/g.24445  ORF Transcript_13944/g.24445 Transcript_13944/m.24445 type:complete len:161 (-) Transcript_13944:1075-1557(-)
MERSVDVVKDSSNWIIRIKKESQSAKTFDAEYGFLLNKKDQNGVDTPHARATVKYHHLGHYTISQKKIHLEGMASIAYKEQEAVMQQLASQMVEDGSSNSRPNTALVSTLMSHRRRMTDIQKSTAGFDRTSRVYGSRHTIEQFGVSDYGVKETQSKFAPR